MKSTPMQEIHLKGWGSEKWIVNNESYCGKILHFMRSSKHRNKLSGGVIAGAMEAQFIKRLAKRSYIAF